MMHMKWTVSSILLWAIFASSCHAQDYNAPECPSWPSGETWDELASNVTILHGPFGDTFYEDSCEILGTDAYAISKAGDGICMHVHACKHEFCRSSFPRDLPAYIVEATSETDIQAALAFARQYHMEVTVKTTGHSYHGASTAKNSLLIWMQNYPKDGTITENYATCDDETVDAVIGVNGGETWNDVIEAVGPNYHIVTGGARTVSAAGGWLQGSGLSFSSRQYGLGVDQAVDFTVVLADGTIVTASACENEDLFWALRGGGGGTFGVVMHVTYKLHPLVPITTTSFFIDGFEKVSTEAGLAAVSLWLKFWIETSPTLDNRVGGYWNAAGAYLVFAGTREEADAAFLDEFEDWYNNTLVPNTEFAENGIGAPPPSSVTTTDDSWYEHKGGAEGFNNPDGTDATGDAYRGTEFIAARLMPIDTVQNDPEGVYDLLLDLIVNGELGTINYFLGGTVNDVADDETAVSPALRNSIWNIFTSSDKASDKLINFIPNNVTGACFNHHSPTEPDWRNALWGEDTYNKLLEIKDKYDPVRVFNCWHCVGYVGDENPKADTDYDPVCPDGGPTIDEETQSPTEAPASAGFMIRLDALIFSMATLLMWPIF